MAKTQYKYNLKLQYSLLPRTIALADLIKALEKLGIPERTFYRDRAIGLKHDEDIPVERLLIYAKVFDCELTDLINYKVKAKSIVPVDQKFKSPLSKP